MPLVLADRVNETTTTTSTGTITLAGAVSGYQSFAVIGNGNTTYYTIVHQTANEWEVGIGTYTSSGTLLSRDTVLSSSNSGSLVNFSAGTKFVFCDYPAGRAVYLDTATNVTIPGLTLSGGTANGVLYLNGSKVATSGSALVFDGTNLGVGAASGTSSGYATAPQLLNYSASATNLLNASNTTSIIRSALYRDSTGGGIISMAKFRGTYASPTVVQSGDTSGRLFFDVWGGSNLRRIAEVGALVDTYTSDTNISGTLYFATSTSGNSSSTEKMRLTAAGDLGIGTASPAEKLEVAGNIKSTGNTVSVVPSTNTGSASFLSTNASGNFFHSIDNSTGAAFGAGAYARVLYSSGAYPMVFFTNDTERARITSGGDLLVGTTAVGLQTTRSMGFQVNGGCTQFISHSTADGSGDSYVEFGYNSTKIGSITQNGTTAVLYNTTSDRRLKTNIFAAPEASTDIDAIQIVSHGWKSAPDEYVKYGVIAQDLVLVAPQAVVKGDNEEEIEKVWGVDYSKLVPMLVKEVQSLRKRVAELESK